MGGFGERKGKGEMLLCHNLKRKKKDSTAHGTEKFVFSSVYMISWLACNGEGPFFFLNFQPLLMDAVEKHIEF